MGYICCLCAVRKLDFLRHQEGPFSTVVYILWPKYLCTSLKAGFESSVLQCFSFLFFILYAAESISL